MTTRQADPAFGIPDEHDWSAHSGAPNSGIDAPISVMNDHRNGDIGQEAEMAVPEVQWVNSELHTIASTIEVLQNRLEQANARLSTVSRVETTEEEIGRLFVEAQRFSEAALSNLESKIHEILCEAEVKAKQILAEATEEAHEIRRQAQQAAVTSTRSVRELQSAIAGFTTVNSELLKELSALNSMLIPTDDRGEVEMDHSSAIAHPTEHR